MIKEGKIERTIISQVWKNVNINNAIRKAIEDGEMKVFYQPKVEAGSTRVVGAEALIRWQRLEGSYVFPDDFIPELEQSGKIVDLDYFVYRTVFRKIRKRLDMGKPVVPVSVNVSRVHLRDLKIYDYLKFLFRKYNIPPKYIELELTESMYTGDLDRFRPLIEEFRAAGGRVSMDDFGSGYSSLNLLTDLPIDTIKIDKVFLKHDELLENEKTILGCVIEMAKRLKLDVLCEGVETLSQSRFLSKMGCDMFQGYLYAKPLPEKEYYAYLEKHLDTEINEIHFAFQGNLCDDSGTYEGIFRGEGEPEYVPGPAEGMMAIHFCGGEPFSDCVELPADVLWNDSFTISMWIKEEKAGLWSSVYYAGYENGFCNIMPKAWDMHLSFRIKDGDDPAGWNDVGSEIVPLDQWTMVTCCYNSANHVSTIYINGRRCGILEGVINLTDPKVVFIGGDIYVKGYQGLVSDLRIFDQPLSFEVVQRMYQKIRIRMQEGTEEAEEHKPEVHTVRFPLNQTLMEENGTAECIFHGKEAVYGEGPVKGTYALRLAGGMIGENVLELPDKFADLESFTVSYWIKDENPREWVSSFYMKREYGFLSEVPYAPEKRTIFRVKDFRESEDVWHDSVRERIMKKDVWHHIILVYNADVHMVSHYVDGKYNGIKDDCFPTGRIQKILFGGDEYQRSFEGYLADIRIFDRALSGEEIRKM